jgi:hypothetical protein
MQDQTFKTMQLTRTAMYLCVVTTSRYIRMLGTNLEYETLQLFQTNFLSEKKHHSFTVHTSQT